MTYFTTNAPTSATQISTMLHRFGKWASTCILEFRMRRAHSASLRSLKSRDLKDIGLINSDISAAGRLPLSADASTALYCARLGRTGNW